MDFFCIICQYGGAQGNCGVLEMSDLEKTCVVFRVMMRERSCVRKNKNVMDVFCIICQHGGAQGNWGTYC
jgi:hypothetical protein